MNTQPHVHELTIRHRSDEIEVIYGDQVKFVSTKSPFFRFRLKRTVRLIIERHDNWQHRALKTQTCWEKVQSEVNAGNAEALRLQNEAVAAERRKIQETLNRQLYSQLHGTVGGGALYAAPTDTVQFAINTNKTNKS